MSKCSVRGLVAMGAALVAALVLSAAAQAAGRCGAHPWCDTSLNPDARAALLLGAMSQSDKIAMLTAGPAPDVDVPAATSADGAVGVRTTGEVGRTATAFPAATALAANFDGAMARAYGAAVGAEQRAHGSDFDFGPTMNIMRTPLGGRTFEAYGEDPFLSAETAVGWIDGLQSQGVMANAKHFIENDQEGQGGVSPLLGANGGRQIVNAIVDERTLHEIELRPFAASVQDAHVASVMCSYNQINGRFGCDNPDTLQTVLRSQLGFKGIILSDLFAAHTPQADLNAGMDWDIGANSDNAPAVNAALASGQVSQQTLDARVSEYLRTLFAYGFFDRAAFVNDPSKVDQAHSTAVGVAAEQGGATLLKNDGTLPLAGQHQRIAVIGQPANHYVFGLGSSQVTPNHTVTVLQGIQARAARAGDTVAYDDGTDVARAQAVARAADVVIVVAGDTETEGADKLCMSLTPQCAPTQASTLGNFDPAGQQSAWGDQDALIAGVAAANPRTVVVLQTGAPVLTPWRGQLAGLLEVWYPGEDGGTAVARVLWGDADPGGRLPVTFPASPDQEPTAGSTASYPGTPKGSFQSEAASGTLYDETYTEGVFPGYRWFDQHALAPAYPFGHGLSYTTFRLSNLQVRGLTVTATVTNTGQRSGYAVPQVYVGLPSTPAVPQPPAQLGGFTKLALAPGQRRTVTVDLPDRAFQFWDTGTHSWQRVAGCAKVRVGFSSRDLPLQGDICGGASSAGTSPGAAAGCKSRRKVTFTLPRGVKRVRLIVAGKRRTVRVRRRQVAVSFFGLPRHAVRVRITARVHGRRYVRRSTIHPCTRKRGRQGRRRS